MHTPASGTEAEQPRFDRDIEPQDTPIKPEDFVTHNGLLLVRPVSVAACRDPCLLHLLPTVPKRLSCIWSASGHDRSGFIGHLPAGPTLLL